MLAINLARTAIKRGKTQKEAWKEAQVSRKCWLEYVRSVY